MHRLWITILIHLPVISSMIVIDNSTPKDSLVSTYCQLSHLCSLRGSHILCLNNPIGYGPACHNVNKQLIMTPDIAFRILGIFNGMRSAIATGTEMWRDAVDPDGKKDTKFPRGYGMWKLEWDSELATLANIWANQCVDRSNYEAQDFCHATKRFPFSTQIIGSLINNNITESSVDMVFRPAYTQAKTGTVDLLTLKWCLKKCGDPRDKAYPYLQIINAANTHVGCGISVVGQQNPKKQRLLMVCNFSHQTRHFTSVYPFEPPQSNGTVEYTQCGCPPNALETPECLCRLKTNRCTGTKCSPTMLVLPVVAFEEKAVTLD